MRAGSRSRAPPPRCWTTLRSMRWAWPSRQAYDFGASPPKPGCRGRSSRAHSAPSHGAPPMPELVVEGLVHVYREGGVRAVDGVDLRIGAGERVAIVGQNGSGKTTLVRHLNGLLRPSEGRVLVDGVDAARLTVAHLARSVGLVFQDPDRQIFAGSVRAEVEYGPRNLGVRGEELRSTVESALAAVGLEPEARTNPYDLGASRRKLLALASVLAMRTEVLVLDEPTTGQDERGVERVRAVIEGAHGQGRT